METNNLPDRSEVASMGTATAVEKAFTGWPLPSSVGFQILPFEIAMKKQRPPRPKHKKGRPASIAKPKGQIVSSTTGTRPLGSSRTSSASVERPTTSNAPIERPARPLVEPKRIELSDRGGMSNARGWRIFAGFIISWLLLAGAVVLFATHWAF
jgi:hypothetical protein